MTSPSPISHNDSVKAQYHNDLQTKWPYTGRKEKVETININFADTYSDVRSNFSGEPITNGSFNGGDTCGVIPGSSTKRRGRDFFNLAEENAKQKDTSKPTYEEKSVKEEGFLKGTILGLTKQVGFLNIPKNAEGKYPNLAYVIDSTGLPPEAFVNVPKEALENPAKFVVKNTLQLDPKFVNSLYD